MLPLKADVLQMISSIDDETVLAILKNDIEYLTSDERRLTREMSPEDRIELIELMNDDDEENTITYEEYMKATERWRTK